MKKPRHKWKQTGKGKTNKRCERCGIAIWNARRYEIECTPKE